MKHFLDVATLALTCASTVASPLPEHHAAAGPPAAAYRSKPHAVRLPNAATLYSPHARRLVQGLLRLKLDEMREADLDRARAVIERRLDVNTLFTNETSVQQCGNVPQSWHPRE